MEPTTQFIFAVIGGFLLYFNFLYNPWLKLDEYRQKWYSSTALKEIQVLVILINLIVLTIGGILFYVFDFV